MSVSSILLLLLALRPLHLDSSLGGIVVEGQFKPNLTNTGERSFFTGVICSKPGMGRGRGRKQVIQDDVRFDQINSYSVYSFAVMLACLLARLSPSSITIYHTARHIVRDSIEAW